MGRPHGARNALTDAQLKEPAPRNMMIASCWCDRHYVFVSRNQVLDGTTRTCGLKDCGPNVGPAANAASARSARLAARAERPY
jgi:hypothetical protein